jgi:ParB family chromosome partitioning protein
MSIYDKLGAKTAGIKARAVEKPAERPIKTAPSAHWDATERMHQAEQKVAELQTELGKVMEGAQAKLKLSDLIEVEGRRRKLTSEEFNELKSNLEKHPLVTPITVRSAGDGKFEIISGHNRVAVYRELGKADILAVVQDFDDSASELSALFANLLHPTLPDVQKFAAFKRLQEITGKNQKELAEASGITAMSITRLMSYDKLPSEALALINDNPDKIGGTAALQLATIAKDQSKVNIVVYAITEVIAGHMTQAEAVLYVKNGGNSVAQKPKAQRRDIQSGKKKYCTMIPSQQSLRIDFKTVEERIEMEQTIEIVLKKRADDLK